MSNVLQKFNVFSKISEELKQKIKLFHNFGIYEQKSVLFVTNEEKVFSFGNNYSGRCGFGRNKRVLEPTTVSGRDFVLALNQEKRVFS